MSILDKKVDNIEEPVYSLSKQKEIKQKEFREYLVDKNVVLAFVKCKLFFIFINNWLIVLLALRSSNTPPEEPIEILKDYFGSAGNSEWDENSKIRSEVNKLREENKLLEDEIENLELQREEIIELKNQRDIERQQKLVEEEAKKNVKKAGKK